MGRFYRTASANPLDYMYRINTPLMEKVVSANDNYITQNLQQTAVLDNLATSFPYLQQDDERARSISNDYSNKIEEISKAIKADPANWRKQLDPIRTVSKDLQNNYKQGEISKIAENYSKYKNVSDYIDKSTEEFTKTGKGISADRARAYKQAFLNNFQGTAYDAKSGKYNQMTAFNPMADIDIRKKLGEEMDKIKADKNSYRKDAATGDEWYFNSKLSKWEGVTPEKILSIATDRLSDPQLRDYIRQDSGVGLISGVQFDSNGNIAAPYSYHGVDISPDEKASMDAMKSHLAKVKDPNLKQQLQNNLDIYEKGLKNRRSLEWNNSNPLSNIMRGLVNEYSYGQTETEDTLKNNAKGAVKFNQAQQNFRQGRQLGQAASQFKEKEKAINDRFNATHKLAQDRLDFDKYKWDNPHAAGSGTGTGKGKNGKDTETPVESSVSRLSTNSFEDWTTQDVRTGQQVKVLSNSGLASDIDRLKSQANSSSKSVDSLDNQMKDFLGGRNIEDLPPLQLNAYNNMRVQKENEQAKLSEYNKDLEQRRQWYKGSVDAALANNPASLKNKDGIAAAPLTKDEIQAYRTYSDNDDKTNEVIDSQIKDWKRKVLTLQSQANEAGNRQDFDKRDRINRELAIINSDTQRKRMSDLSYRHENYLKAKEKVDERRENFLAQMRYTPIDTDAINVGTKDNKDLVNMIFSNTQGLKMYDQTGNKTDNIQLEGKGISWFAPKADNYSGTFSGTNTIKDYMDRYHVIPKIEQVGNTTKIGSGNALAKITFNDPTGQIPSTPYYVELTPELQKAVGTRLTTNTNPDIKSIASKMTDDFGNDLRRQLISPNIQQTAGKDGFEPGTKTIFISNGSTKIPLQVTTFVGNDGQAHLNVMGHDAKTGNLIPLPGTTSGIPGWFNGPEDLIDYMKYKTQK